MSALDFWFASPLVERLGRTLVHFLWQGAAIAAILEFALAILKRKAPAVRHAVACGSLFVIALAPIFTFAIVRSNDSSRVEISSGVLAETDGLASIKAIDAEEDDRIDKNRSLGMIVVSAPLRSSFRFAERIDRWSPFVVAVWLAGVIVLSIRLAGGVFTLRRLRTSGVRPLKEWYEARDRLLNRMRIHRVIDLFESSVTLVPLVLGVFKPAVLIPSSAVLGLSAAEFEAILAHEFAHVMRHDLIINIIQNVVETLLFYHPAVWRVSSVIRRERESCCDDVAVEVCGDRLSYARALASLESIRSSSSYAFVTASGGSLVDRIRRILKLEDSQMRRTKLGSWIAPVIAAAIGLTLLTAAYARRQAKEEKKPAVAAGAKLLASLRETARTVALMKDERRAAQTLIDIARSQAKLGDKRSARETVAMIEPLLKKNQDLLLMHELIHLADVQCLSDDFSGARRTSMKLKSRAITSDDSSTFILALTRSATIQTYIGEKDSAIETLRIGYAKAKDTTFRSIPSRSNRKENQIYLLLSICSCQTELGDLSGAKTSLATALDLVQKIDDGIVSGRFLIREIPRLQAILIGKAASDASFERGVSLIEKSPFTRQRELAITTVIVQMIGRGEIDRAIRMIDDAKLGRARRARIVESLVENGLSRAIVYPRWNIKREPSEGTNNNDRLIDPRLARQALDRIIELVPSFDQPVRFKIYDKIGWTFLESGDTEGAIRSLRSAIKTADGDPEYLQKIALLYAEIIQHYIKAMKIDEARKLVAEFRRLIDGTNVESIDISSVNIINDKIIQCLVMLRDFDEALVQANKYPSKRRGLESLLEVAGGIEKNGDEKRAERIRSDVVKELDRIETDKKSRELYFPRSEFQSRFIPGISLKGDELYEYKVNDYLSELLAKSHRYVRASETAKRIPPETNNKTIRIATVFHEEAISNGVDAVIPEVMKLEPVSLRADVLYYLIGRIFTGDNLTIRPE